MMSVYEPWNEARGAGIIAEHGKLEGATLVILHAMQEAFGYVDAGGSGLDLNVRDALETLKKA